MPNWTECVIDASMGARDGVFTFCPIEGDIHGEFQVVTGMNFIGAAPRDLKIVAIIHPDGQDAVEAFCAENRAALDMLKELDSCKTCGQPVTPHDMLCTYPDLCAACADSTAQHMNDMRP